MDNKQEGKKILIKMKLSEIKRNDKKKKIFTPRITNEQAAKAANPYVAARDTKTL